MLTVQSITARMTLVLGGLVMASASHATTITSLTFSGNGGNVSTINGDGFAPLGLTATGGTTKPFLNNLNTKAVNLGVGTYLTFNEPFFSKGNSLEVIANFSNGAKIDISSVLPDLNTAGKIIFSKSSGLENLSLQTAGLVADRISFGNAPSAFNPSGTSDTILQLMFSEGTIATVPEPASMVLTGAAGAFCLGLAIFRRSQARKR